MSHLQGLEGSLIKLVSSFEGLGFYLLNHDFVFLFFCSESPGKLQTSSNKVYQQLWKNRYTKRPGVFLFLIESYVVVLD